MKSLTLTIKLADDECCPDCGKPIDENTIGDVDIYLGECSRCGEDIYLLPDAEGIEWHESQ